MDEVCNWLNSIGPQYGQYADLFEVQGWDDMDNVATMSETDIQTLGITKPGHVNKLNIAIKKLHHKQEQNASQSQNVNLQDDKTEKNQNKVQEQNLSKEASQIEESSPGATCHAINTEVHGGAQQLALERTFIADPQQSKRKGIVNEDPNIVTVKEDIYGVEKVKDSSEINTALALMHNSETDGSSNDTDEDYTEPPDNVVMQLPPSHAVSAERSPTVAHLNAVSSRSVHRSTVVQGSKDVTIAETVEIHKHEHTADSQDNYKGQIKMFMRNYKRTEHLFVKTRAYEEVSDILEVDNWAVIIGNPGFGKSTIALHQMLEHSRQGYEPIIVTSITDWKSMIEGHVKDSKKQFVLIDDIFGSLSVDERMLHDWSSMFVIIDKLIIERKGGLKVICTTRKYIFSQVSTKLKRFKLFGKLHMVDMAEDQYKLLQTEKVEMLVMYFKHYNVKMEETFIDSASKVASDYGFPHCVEMFCTRTMLRERGLAFFETPLELLEKEIENLLEYDKDKYCALLMILFSPRNAFNITYLGNKDPELTFLDQQHPSISLLWYMLAETNSYPPMKIKDIILKAISSSLKLSRIPDDTFLPGFVSVFKLLNNVFIKETENGVYTFKHDSFKEIVSIVSLKSYQSLSLQLLELDTIVETTTYFTYKPSLQEIVVVLPESCTSQLIKRFNEALQAGYGYAVSKHQAWNETDFIVKWLQSINLSPSFDKSCLVAYTGRIDSNLLLRLKSGFLSSLCSNQKEKAVFLILQDKKLKNIFISEDGIKELSRALLYASREDCSEDLCDTLIHHGADVNYDEDGLELLGDKFRHIIRLWETKIEEGMSSALSNAIFSDNLEKCKYLIKKGARLICGVFYNNIVLNATKKGCTKCLPYILEYMNSLNLPTYFNKSKDFITIEYLYGEIYSKFLCQLKTNTSNPELKPIHSSKNVQIFRILSKEYTLEPVLSKNLRKQCDKPIPTLFEDNDDKIPMILGLLDTGCLTPDLIDLLVEKGCDVNIKYNDRPIMFHFFNKENFQPAEIITMLKSLLTHGLNIHATDTIYGRTALSFIFRDLNPFLTLSTKVMFWLLDMKVDPNIPDNEGYVPLFYALEKLNDMHILKFLIKQTKQLENLTSIRRNNCFHFLAKNDRLTIESIEELISLLLEENVNINHLDNEGRSCLALTNKTNIELFLNHGADPNIQDEKGMTAAMVFIKESYIDSHLLESLCILTKHNMTINAKDKKGQNIVHYMLNKVGCTDERTDALIRTQQNKKYGSYVSLFALDNNNNKIYLQIVDMFLKQSCDINEKDNCGITPLMLAVGNGTCSLSLLNFLIDNGADVSNIDHSGRSILDHCLESCMEDLQKAEIIKMIILTKGFHGVTASSVAYALKECKQKNKPIHYFYPNGPKTLTLFFKHVTLSKNNFVDICH